MRIALLSTSDCRGGAAVVSRRLVECFNAAGHEATLVVLNRYGESRGDVREPALPRWRRRIPFYRERLPILLANGFNRRDLFKVSTATAGISASRLREIERADVIMLGWINQGFLSLKELDRIAGLGKPVIWTMHDMWCFTGICHLSGSCGRYRQECGCCPFLHRRANPDDLSHRVWLAKRALYSGHPGMRFVAVSNWLKEKAAGSSLLAGRPITVIPNPYDIPSDPPLNTSARPPVIAMGAARLDDEVKNLPLAIDSLNLVYDRLKGAVPGVKAVFFGGVRDRSVFDRLRMPHELKGSLGSGEVARLLNGARVVLSTSRFEMLPTTIVEGLAWGCVAVATSTGGQADIVDDGLNGYLVGQATAPDVAEALIKALECGKAPADLRASVAARFDGRAIAAQYLQLMEGCR